MSTKHYGLLGKNNFHHAESAPEPWIEMSEPRPEFWYTANVDGTWTEDLDLKAEIEAAAAAL